MKRSIVILALAGVLGFALFGCGGDVVTRLLSDASTRTAVMEKVAANPEFAGQMMDRLLGGEATRTVVIQKMMANGDAMQAMMMGMAKDPNAVDGVIGLAVQDSAMRAHVMTLMKGMRMGGMR